LKPQTWLSINFFLFFFTWGVFIPYWNTWLINEKGLSIQAAGTIIAVGLLIRAFSTFFVFPFLSKKMAIGHEMKMISLLSVLILLLFLPVHSFRWILAAMILFSFVYPMMLAISESLGSIMMKTDQIQYGISRSFGSIGYATALVAVGAILSFYNESSIFWTMFVSCCLMAIAAHVQTPKSLMAKHQEQSVSYLPLFRSKRFMAAMVVCILIQGAHASYYNYGFIYLQKLNAGDFWSGMILNLAVLAETLFFMTADRLFQKVSTSRMFAISAAASIVRWGLVYLVPTVWMFIFTQFLHSLTFALAHYAFIRLLHEELDNRLIPAAQGIYASLAMGLSISVFTFLGSYLYSKSAGLAFAGMAAAVIPSLFIALMMVRKFEMHPVKE
jgi:PPP family 3-phenylpropionic acid transporter